MEWIRAWNLSRRIMFGLGDSFKVFFESSLRGMGGFRFLEHMSDAFIEAWGDSFEEAYVEAAKAFYELVSSMSGVEPRVERVVEAEGRDLQELLYDMLEKLIILFDSEGFLASKIEVEELKRGARENYLRLRLLGEPYDPGRHRHGIHVKAVTYHLMEVRSEDSRKVLRFLLDI